MHPVRNYFPKKTIMFYCKTFFLLQRCSLLDCSKQLTEKTKSEVTVLVSSKTAVKGGHGFENAVGMENLRGGD